MEELLIAIDPLIQILTQILGKVPELIDELLDNPIGLIILLFVVPTILGFCWNIIKVVFDGVNGVFGVIVKILFLPIDLIIFIGNLITVHNHNHKHNQSKYDEEFGQKHGYEDEGEYQRIEFGELPTTHKKAKPTSPDQDLAASLKTNLLDE